LSSARPDERRRARGDLQLEARQIADAQRRVGSESSQTAPGAAGEDARRRLAAEQERLADRTQRLGEQVKQLAAGSGTEPDAKQAMNEAGRELDRQNVAGRMRESAQALRSGKPDGNREPEANPGQSGAEAIARALDKVADQLGASGERDADSAKLSDQLSRAQELRDRLSRLSRSMEELKGSEGRDGSTGSQGSSGGGRGSAERLQRTVEEQMQEAQKLAEELRRDNPGMQKGGSTPEQWQRSVSAPGTEAFKQDFERWESLKKNLLVALEQTETRLSDQLRARENRERLNAGRHDAVADSYRELVDRYYQSLAAPRRHHRQ
jgi:hypothetical protein